MRWKCLILLSLVVCSVLLTPGRRDLFAGDETKYGQVIREMRARGALLVPYVHGEPYAHKPPLHFWVLYGTTAVAGENSVWPFVLPSIAAYLLLVLLVGFAARELWREESCMSPFVIATFLLSWGAAQTARMDLAFTAAITAAAVAIWRASQNPLRQRSLYLAAVATAAGVLVKGPMAVVIVMLVGLFTLRGIPLLRVLPPAAVAVALPLLWLVPALEVGGEVYAHELLITQNIGRAVNAWVHGEPPWFYVVRSPLIFFPWFFLSIVALWWAWQQRRVNATRFCVVWFGSIVIPFSLLSGKLDIYLLPALVPLSLLIGRLVWNVGEEPWVRRVRIANLASLALLMAVTIAAAAALSRPSSSPEIRILAGTPLAAVLPAIAVLLLTVLVVGGRRQRRDTPAPGDPRQLTFAVGLGTIVTLVAITATATPQLSEISSSRPLVRALATQSVHGRDIALYASPDLWSRDLPDRLRAARAVSRDELVTAARPPLIIAVSRRRAAEIADVLRSYRRVASVRMIGKDFDVYRRD